MNVRPWSQILLVLAFSLLCSCRTSRVHVSYNEEVDFFGYKNYAWLKPVAKSSQGYISLGEQNMRKMLSDALANKGLLKTDPDKAEVLVAINVTDKEKVHYTSHGGGYYPYHHRHWGYSGYWVEPQHYTESTIVLAFVDPKTKQSLWEGVAKDCHYDKIKQEDLQKIVDAFFKHFPPMPAGMDEYDPRLD